MDCDPNKNDKPKVCWNCEREVRDGEYDPNVHGEIVCNTCMENYYNRTGYCSLGCCLGGENACDQSC